MLQSDGSNSATSQIDELISTLQSDYKQAQVSQADRQMLEYSVKLTCNPQSIQELDIQLLRQSGFEDLAIHDIVCSVGYFAFVNRVADGLGVELEER